MNIYFDTEFTGLNKNTTLISLGLVADNNNWFYAELTDYDKSQCDEWIQDNVISNLILNDFNISTLDFSNNVSVRGNRKRVRGFLLKWLKQFNAVQFVSDVCHYDFILLIDLLGETAFDLPSNCCPACHDINQEITEYFNAPEILAFNESREDILSLLDKCVAGKKHNALYDARVIKEIACHISRGKQ